MLRELAHLQEQLGADRFAALINSVNTGEVKTFCDNLILDALPSTITIAGRTYEMLGLLRGDEKSISFDTLIERAQDTQAHLDKDDGQYLLDHQEEIPKALRDIVIFVFTDWHDPDCPDINKMAYVAWFDARWGDCWLQRWYLPGGEYGARVRVLRRGADRYQGTPRSGANS